MSILVYIFIIVLKIIYFFLKLFPTKNKITFISRQSNNINIDFKLLTEDLNNRYPNYKIVVLCKKIDGGILNKIKYVFHIFRQMYHIATSKVVVLDSYCIPISILKHKNNLKVVQMWHALGSFKKFGLSIKDKKEGSSTKLINIMKMHQNYNYIFCSSKECRKNFAEAFGYDEDKVLIYPLPRLDLYEDNNYKEKTINKIYSKYPELKNKKNILYAPTFRIDGANRKKSKSTINVTKLIENIDYSKYNLIIKFHPLSDITITDKRIICDKEIKTSDFLFVSDYVITDYSAMVYEAAYLLKPLYFYSYDIEEYMKNRDFYLDIKKDLPGLMTGDSKLIIDHINNNEYDLYKIKKFKKNNIGKCKVSYTKDINNFIISLISCK